MDVYLILLLYLPFAYLMGRLIDGLIEHWMEHDLHPSTIKNHPSRHERAKIR